jgi:Protein of unknown function (DUF998)
MTPATSPAKPSATSAAPASAATSTRARLLCGVLAGPLFLVVGFAQALTRDGFDLTRHPFSFLSLGDLGWIQISNFVLSGLLFVVAATGFQRALRPGRGGTWGPLLIGAMGIGMICGGVFLPDPAYGFPAGTPDGRPDVISWHGNLHGLAFVVAILSWTAACFVFARRFAAVEQRRWAAYSAATGVALVVPAAFLGTSVGVVLLYVAATLGWIWTTAVSARLITELESRPAVTR